MPTACGAAKSPPRCGAAIRRAVIVHNQAAAERVRREAPGAELRIIPMPFAAPGRELDRAEARRKLGLPAGAFLVGCFGYMREARRLTVALRTFEALRRDYLPNAEFLLVGQFTSQELERLLEHRLARPATHRRGYVSDEEFDLYAGAADVVVNLRHPSAGETSGVAVRLISSISPGGTRRQASPAGPGAQPRAGPSHRREGPALHGTSTAW